MRNVHGMDEVELFSKAVLEAFCPRVCAHYLRLLQRPQTEWPGEDINFRKPLAVSELGILTIL